MNKSLEISQRRRKKIASILLLNFLFSTVLFAFPQSKCDGMCSIKMELHECADAVEMIEMSCCDMMDMENNNSIPCEMEFADNSCDYIIDANSDFMFLVPKTVETNLELIKVDNITLSIDEKKPNSFFQAHDLISYSSPPLYITISSFLI